MLLAALAPVASAAAADRVLVANVPRGLALAQRTGAPPADQRLRVGFVLAHPRPRRRGRAPARRSTIPASPSYHRFLTPAQYAQRFGVPATTRPPSARWLTAGGLHVDHVTGAGDYVLASGTVAQVGRLRTRRSAATEAGARPSSANDTAARRCRAALPVYAVLGLNTSQRHRTMAELPAQGTPNIGSRSAPGAVVGLRAARRRRPARAPRWRSSATARPTPSSTTCTRSTPSTACPRCPSTSCTRPPTATSPTTSGNVEWNIDMQAIHGMAPGISQARSSTSRRRWPTPSSSRRSATWVNDPAARRS